MEDTSNNKENKIPSKHVSVGLLAHVDAGKTTLSESLLYLSGVIRRLGRVDHKDAFLDTHELERERGITIFSKQAVFPLGDMEVTLLDTPGHVDFSAEMERTLQVLDYGVLVINGADGVQGHTETLWRLLKRYHIPVFLFVNKMDMEGTDKGQLLEELRRRLSSDCVDFDSAGKKEEFFEQLAVCNESLLEKYLADGEIKEKDIIELIKERNVFPCYFGSALKLDGVKEFLEGLIKYMKIPTYPKEFGAKVYKIGRDNQGNRLTYLKITGGSLKVKETIEVVHKNEREEPVKEKADQIRIYSGARYDTAGEASAGMVCAVTGFTDTYPGQGLGMESASHMPVLEPVLTYRIVLPKDTDTHTMLGNLQKLQEEVPELGVVWNNELEEIYVRLMGEVQIEIITRLVNEKFGVLIQFDAGNIVYRETIKYPVEGIGHFEPLRHYAEVHLLMEPLEEGSGLVFSSDVSQDELDINWQRLILTHLEEKEHVGVLTGSAVTDMKITLIAGRAHQKHTEGGDFRQATYRAVRQGLKKAESILLEPYYKFRLEVPAECVGRAMSDIQRMNGDFEPPVPEGEMSVLNGSAPVYTMRDYQREVISYTKGRGHFSCRPDGYKPCHNQQEVIEENGYDPEQDTDNPAGSVFCAHGAGFVVNWDMVEEYMHVDSGWRDEAAEGRKAESNLLRQESSRKTGAGGASDEKELEEIFTRTYGPIRRKQVPENKRVIGKTFQASSSEYKPAKKKKQGDAEEYLLVDGYNIIFAWEELKELAKVNIMSARDRLIDILSNYQGFRKMTLIVVFDAYKVEGNAGAVSKYHNIYVVYTKEAETADQYIEKTVHRIGHSHHVVVATSDAMEQMIILGQGGHRLSAKGLKEEIERMQQELREEYLSKTEAGRSYLFDNITDESIPYQT